jgi:hypothetical protein
MVSMEVELVNDEAEMVNSNAVVSDDEDSDSNSDGTDSPDDDDPDDDSDNDDDGGGGKPRAANKPEPVDINRAHELANHPGETKLLEQARAFNWNLTGTLLSCNDCAQSKATAKPTVKESSRKAMKPGEIMFRDSSGPYKETKGKNRYLGSTCGPAFWTSLELLQWRKDGLHGGSEDRARTAQGVGIRCENIENGQCG